MDLSLIEKKLSSLNEESQAEFGMMTAQHMVEHLTITLKLASGRIAYPPFTPSEQQLEWKEALLFTPMEFPKGIKAPGIKTHELMPLKYPSLQEAKIQLLKAIREYNTFFEENPDGLTNHPRFGMLNHQEWELFHPKHFKHHLGQFNCW